MKLFQKAQITEKLKEKQHLHIDPWLCHACGACVGLCPTNALFLFDLTLRVNEEVCLGCGQCVKTCPMGALLLENKAIFGEGA